jgi:hypothetical protein
VVAEIAQRVFGDGAAIERGNVCGVDGVGEVSDREDARATGGLGGVDEGATGMAVHFESCGAGQFVVWCPVAGEDDRVAVDGAAGAGVEILEFDGADATVADDSGDAGAGSDGQMQCKAARQRECRV